MAYIRPAVFDEGKVLLAWSTWYREALRYSKTMIRSDDQVITVRGRPMFCPKWYAVNRSKFYMLRSMKAYSFFTFTYSRDDLAARDYKKDWRRFTSTWRKYAKQARYFGVWELQKDMTPHRHFVSFDNLDSETLVHIAKYWSSRHGFVDCKRIIEGENRIHIFKLWMEPDGRNHWKLHDVVEKRKDKPYRQTSYLLKYVTKEPKDDEDRYKAHFKYYGFRSMSYTRNLPIVKHIHPKYEYHEPRFLVADTNQRVHVDDKGAHLKMMIHTIDRELMWRERAEAQKIIARYRSLKDQDLLDYLQGEHFS